MGANPFTYGNPISTVDRFFGRDREVEQVLGRLGNREQESSSVVGDRRIGKTSLLHHCLEPSVRAPHGLAGREHVFVYSDLQMVDLATTPRRLWQRLLRQVVRRAGGDGLAGPLAQAVEDGLDTAAIDDFFEEVDARGLHVVMLLDEFEHVTENRNFESDFFNGLRSLAIHHRLSVVTASRRELVEMCHSESIRSSPFFNIFANINIRLFDEPDANDLILASLAGAPVEFSSDECRLVLDLSGRHPFFLQIACHFLYDAHARGRPDPVAVTAQFEREAAPHFAELWRVCDDHERILLTVTALLEHDGQAAGRRFRVDRAEQLYGRARQSVDRLSRRGLVIEDGDRYTLFSSTLGRWVLAELTAAMSEQQTYDEWLRDNESLFSRTASGARKELGYILPRVAKRYRSLLIAWLSDPAHLAAAGRLIAAALGVG